MPELDRSLCISCGLCAHVCPTSYLYIENGTVSICPTIQCMECWHCAAICPKHAIRQEGIDLYPDTHSAELEALITSRRSVRHFKVDPPAKEIISYALEIAAWAPTGKNERTYGWTVVYGSDRVQALLDLLLDWCKDKPRFKILKWLVKHGNNPITCNAPCVIFTHNAETASNPETDCVIAATTAELLLTKQGIGTCWGGYLRRTVAACPEAKEFLGIPEGHNVYSALLIGMPDNEPYQRPAYRTKPNIQWK